MEASLKEVGGTVAGTALAPLGTTDFSAYLIQAQAAQPDAIIVLNAGQDTVNSLKQIVQFGIDKQIHIAGAQQELEVLKALPPEARIGTWVFEWYWKQPGVAGVDAFVDTVKKRTGAVPTARTWFGYTSVHTYGLVANQEKTLDPVKLAHALQGFALPPEVALQPNKAYYRADAGFRYATRHLSQTLADFNLHADYSGRNEPLGDGEHVRNSGTTGN